MICISARECMTWGVRSIRFIVGLMAGAALAAAAVSCARAGVLRAETFAPHVQRFNSMEDENQTNLVSNANSWDWLKQNIPLFECPDRDVEEMYYFRWWSFRKHIKQTTNGFVITEFLLPVGHAGQQNTISCASGHHVTEARWLRDQRYLDGYITFWFRGADGKPQQHFHRFSSWMPAAIYDRNLVQPDKRFVTGLLPDLIADYEQWEHDRRSSDGLFWQFDVRDGMEESISGSRVNKNARPTINSYMFGNARAIAAIGRLAGKPALAAQYEQKAADLKRLTQLMLWNPEAHFFEVRGPDGLFSGVREAIGFIPWCFHLPDPGYEAAWQQFSDPEGFRAPFGLTTAERRHPQFRSHGCCKCEWDGAVWPFATSQTLTALGNVLRDYTQAGVGPRDYFDAFLTYTRSQHYDGRPYIGEYLDETTGQWLKGLQERSRYYNHSTYADLLITGVAGLRPRGDDTVEVQPLLPENVWDWFCLDNVRYHGRDLTILWDKEGRRYRYGAGLVVLANGKVIARGNKLERITGTLR